jgi:hypothetical protein
VAGDLAIGRFLVSTSLLAGLAVAVGFLASGDDGFDWWLTGGLVTLAIGGEGLRLWIRPGRSRRRTATRS